MFYFGSVITSQFFNPIKCLKTVRKFSLHPFFFKIWKNIGFLLRWATLIAKLDCASHFQRVASDICDIVDYEVLVCWWRLTVLRRECLCAVKYGCVFMGPVPNQPSHPHIPKSTCLLLPHVE